MNDNYNSKEYLSSIIKQCENYRELNIKMNCRDTKSIFNLKKLIDDYNIDISHFKLNDNGSRNIYDVLSTDIKITSNIKFRLINELGLEYRCVECGQTKDWNDKLLMLQIDHINGNSKDNQLDNLRLLCPNCHSQTKTFGIGNKKLLVHGTGIYRPCDICNDYWILSRNINDDNKCKSCKNIRHKNNIKKKLCPMCNIHKINIKSKSCRSCSNTKNVKKNINNNIETINIPPFDELCNNIHKLGINLAGKKYNVSERTIGLWLKWYKINENKIPDKKFAVIRKNNTF